MKKILLSLSLFCISLLEMKAQVVINSLGTSYTQNFDGLAGAGTTWTNNSTITGWYSDRNNLITSDGTIIGSSGPSSGLYNLGTSNASDRSLGALNATYLGLRIKNTSGQPVNFLYLTFTGEQWQSAASSVVQSLFFSYRINNTGTITDFSGTYSPDVNILQFQSVINNSSAIKLDGNSSSNRRTFAAVIKLSSQLNNNGEIMLRWRRQAAQQGNNKAEHYLSLDDLKVTFHNTGVFNLESSAVDFLNIDADGLVVSLSGNKTVNRSTGLINGTLNFGNNNVNGGATFTTNANTKIITQNVNGISGSVASTGNESYDATTSYEFQAPTASPFSGTNITQARDITIGANVTLDRSFDILNILTLSAGKLTIPTSRVLQVQSGKAVEGALFSDEKHIVTEVNTANGNKGVFKVNNVPVTTDYTFPVGNGTYYLPATIKPSAVSDLGVVVFNGITRNAQPNGEPVAPELKLRVLDAVWDVTNFSNNGATATVEFAWPETNELEGVDFEDFTDLTLGVSQFNPSTGLFSNFQGEDDTDDQTATRSGINLITSQFIVGERGANSPLPVRFAHVKATRKGAGVDVSFANLTEEEVAVYHVERSTNGYQFQSIGTIAPKANNNSRVDYLFNDAAPAAGDNYYRIRAVETGGKQVYSSVVKLGVNGAAASLVLYPNPASKASGINLQLANLPAGVYSIRLYNGNGQVMATKQLQHTGGSLSEALPLQGAGAGRYIVEVKGAVQFTQSFLLQ